MKTEKFLFINGQFNPLEAKEILSELYHKNINFNKIKNFSSQIRFGENDPMALNQIEELKNNTEQISNLIEEAKTKNKNLQIHSYIEIKYEE